MNVLPLIFDIPKLDNGHQKHTATEWDASFPDWLKCTLVTLLLYLKFPFDHLSTQALTSCFHDSTQYALHNGVWSTFRSQTPPPPPYSNTNPRKHSLTSLCSTSADCERAMCIVTSPLRVVCSWWFTLRSVFLLARLEVPSGERLWNNKQKCAEIVLTAASVSRQRVSQLNQFCWTSKAFTCRDCTGFQCHW